MKVIKPLRLGVLTRTFEEGPKVYLAVTLPIVFPFDEPRRILPEVALWKLAGEALGPESALDELMPKAAGEVLVHGSAYPKGGPATSTFARLVLGPIDKTLYVFGDRRWKLGVQTDPEPFTAMPLGWDRAFGGPGFAANPAGKGHAPITEGGEEIYPLPNVEHPARLVKSPLDRPEPAGFGALDLRSPERQALAGTYDGRWLEQRYPGFPEDFHWSFFNVAPRDQRLPGFFEGDEAFSLHNMHPDEPLLEGRLPGLAARCFVRRRGREALPLDEIRTRIDTVRLFPEQRRAVAFYRGTLEIEEDDADDVLCLLAALEDPAQPKPIAHYQSVLEARLDRSRPHAAIRDRDLLPDLPKGPPKHDDEKLSDMDELMAKEHLVLHNAHRGAARRVEDARRAAEKHGLDPSKIPDVLPFAPASSSLDDFPDQIERATGEAEKAKAEAEQKRAALEASARAACARSGLDYDTVLAREQKRRRLPRFSAKAELDRLQALKTLSDNAGVDLPAVRARLASPDLGARLIEAELQIHEVHRRFGHLLPADGAEADPALRAEIEAGVPAGKTFAGRDLTGVDLSGLDLAGADFEGAFLEGARLRDAKLDGANLKNAILVRADLEGASLRAAVLTGANLGGASLRRVDLGGQSLTGVVLSGARFEGAGLAGASLHGVELSETTLEDCDMARIRLREAIILGSTFRRVVLAGADLGKTLFSGGALEDVDLSAAQLASTVFASVNGARVSFRGARLDGARFVGDCAFSRADFRGASLRGANLRGTRLDGADLAGASADEADFSGCDLREAKLERASARDARFVRADLRKADLRRADLIQAIFQKARVDGAVFEEANLFRADFARVRGDRETALRGAFVKRVRFVAARGGA
ncbi:MAG: DUF2169 domain-containing protein [Byssovorax sp.]